MLLLLLLLLVRLMYYILFFVMFIGSAVFGIKSVRKKDFKKLVICFVLLAAAITGVVLGNTENLMRPRCIKNNISEAAGKILSKYEEGDYAYSIDGYEGNFYIFKKNKDIIKEQSDFDKFRTIDEEYLQRLIDNIGFDMEILDLPNANTEYQKKSILGKNEDTYYNFAPVSLSRSDEYFGLPLGSDGSIVLSSSGYIIRIDYTYTYPTAVDWIISPLVSPALFYRERIDVMKIADSDALKQQDPYKETE